MSEGVRPDDWREREGRGAFAGWIAPARSELLLAPVFAAIVTAPAVAYPLVFAGQLARHATAILAPLTWGLVSLVFWLRAALLLRPTVRFRVENGRLSLRKGAFPLLGAVSLPLAEVTAVRTASRKVKGKLLSYDVWDVVVDARDGTAHRVMLSRVAAGEATWIARRVALASGVTVTRD